MQYLGYVVISAFKILAGALPVASQAGRPQKETLWAGISFSLSQDLHIDSILAVVHCMAVTAVARHLCLQQSAGTAYNQ
jgi:hypothetical protein